MGLELLLGRMGVGIMDSLLMEILRVMELIYGVMEGLMKESDRVIRCMGKGNFLGLMVVLMRGNM